eukprot:10400302-Ditylum_brightwellii.AAC.1
MERLPVVSMVRKGVLLIMCCSALVGVDLKSCSLERCFMLEISNSFPSATFTARLIILRCLHLVACKEKSMKPLMTLSKGQVKCPVCMTVNTPGEMPKMYFHTRNWLLRCSSAFEMMTVSRNAARGRDYFCSVESIDSR